MRGVGPVAERGDAVTHHDDTHCCPRCGAERLEGPLSAPLWSEQIEAEHQWALARVATEDAAERAHLAAVADALGVSRQGPLMEADARMTRIDAEARRWRAWQRVDAASWRYLLDEPARRTMAPAGLYEALAWAREVERRLRNG